MGGCVIEAVVFDMDGVLIDSEPVWERVRRGFVADHGGRWAADAQDRLMGMSTAEWSAYLASDFGIAGLTPQQVAGQVIAAMAVEYARHLPLLPGAVDAVRSLAGRWPLAVASSSPRSLIETVLATAGLGSAFAAVVSSEEVPRGKPAPDVYLAAADRLSAAPDGVRRGRGLLQRPARRRRGRVHGDRHPPARVPAGLGRPRLGPPGAPQPHRPHP